MLRFKTPRLAALRDWAAGSWGGAVVVFLVAVLFFLALFGPSYFPARGDERERAELVGVSDSGQKIICGRAIWDNSREFIYTYRVDRPPPGLPQTFQLRGCPGNGEIGDVVTVARSGTGEDADVTLEPVSARELFAFTLGLAAAVGLLAYVLLAGHDLLEAVRGRRRLGHPRR